MLKKLFILISIITFCGFVASANANNNNVFLDRITVEDGLLQAKVSTIVQDKQGYMWFGTDTGINLYDGYNFSVITTPQQHLSTLYIDSIYIASDGLVWISIRNVGLYTYNSTNGKYNLITKNGPKEEHLNIIKVVEDNKNNIFWFMTETSVLSYDTASQSILQRIDFSKYLDDGSKILDLTIVNNRLLLASHNGVLIYDIASQQVSLLPPIQHTNTSTKNFNEEQSRRVSDVIFVENYYYIGTRDGVFRLSVVDLERFLSGKLTTIFYDTVIENVPTSALLELNNNIYAGTSLGLYRFNLSNQQSEFLFRFGDHFKYVSDAAILTLLSDRNGRLWLGSASSGVYQWDPSTEIITTYTYDNNDKNSLSNGIVNSLVTVEDNMLWVGTDNGLNLIDIDQHTVSHFIQSDDASSPNFIYEVKKDYLNRLWLLTQNGILLFDTAKKEIIPTNFPEQTKVLLNHLNGWVSISSIGEYIWHVSKLGIHKFHALTGELTKLTSLPDFLNPKPNYTYSNTVWGILESFTDDPNDILISTSDTLWLYNQVTKKLTSIFHQKELDIYSSSSVDHWARDSKGLIWLSFAHVGLVAIDPNTYEKKHIIHTYNSILDNDIYGVQIDAADNVWVSGQSGLFRFQIKNKHIRRFTKHDGLAGSEFNYNAFHHLNDGRFVYGGVAGISLFDPVTLGNKHKNNKDSVRIVKVEALSRPLNLPLVFPNNYQIDLAHDDFGIRIDFSDFSYGHIEDPIFKYGFVDGISYPDTKQNFVIFPRLDSGKYRFSVQVKSPTTGEYSKPAIISLNVGYAPLQSPLAYTLYIIAVLFILVIYFRSRQLRQQLLLEEHKEVVYRENRLQLALSASSSDVWDWNAKHELIFAKRFVHALGYTNKELVFSFAEHVEYIHFDDKEKFLTAWNTFINNADADANFECIYRLKCANNSWQWFRDLGKIVEFDNNGTPLRVTGSYTNITDSKATKERAQYYGVAFEQARDWVLILDENLETARANKSMSEAFGWANEEFNLSENLPLVERDRLDYYRKLRPNILSKGYWSGEEVIKTPKGKVYHVITNISVSINIEDKKTHFICIYTDITAQKAAENELRMMANYDNLTGLANRSLLIDRIEHTIAAASRTQTPLALFFVDLDRFKQVNDSLGHDCGDLLLKEVAKRLLAALRKSDTLARIGGDEFVVLIEHFTDQNKLSSIAQELIDLVEKPFALKNHVVSIGASIGIAVYPNDAIDSEGLFRNADVAMYHAKQLGRNNYQFFTQHMNDKAIAQLSRETNLKLGFSNDDFFNVYQPIMNAYTGKSVGAELLMRWRYKGEVVTSKEFIALSEELGLIIPLTEKAIARGFSQLKVWREKRPNYYLSVNFSAKHFSNDGLITSIKTLLKKYELPAKALKIEVTESAFIVEPEKAINTMQELSKMGVLLSLDDFGTGFSSLAYLKKLPLDIIKIDQSFISGIGKEKTDEAIIEATLVLAKSLNMYCIAEGVETQEQLNYLVERECHYIQGYFYYKPLLASELTNKIIKNISDTKVLPPSYSVT